MRTRSRVTAFGLALAGRIKPTTGTVAVDDATPAPSAPQLRELVAVVDAPASASRLAEINVAAFANMRFKTSKRRCVPADHTGRSTDARAGHAGPAHQ